MQAYIPAILAVVVSNALSQSLLKHGMSGVGAFHLTGETLITTIVRIAFDPFVAGGLALMVCSMAGHLWVLSRVPLTFAFPFISISYIVILGVGYFVFGERLNLYHYMGTAFICLGVICIAQAGSDRFAHPTEPTPIASQIQSQGE